MSNQKKLNKLSRGKKSKWSKDADYRIKNRKWLRYSSNIARRILATIEDREKMTQADLALKIGVSPQYVSRIVKGHENLSLSTIAKLSETLGIELISFPEYKFSSSILVGTPFEVGLPSLESENLNSGKIISIASVYSRTPNEAPFNVVVNE